MPLLFEDDGAVVVNSDAVTGAPTAIVRGDNIHFTNSGTLQSSQRGVPALLIEGQGAVIVNAAGGLIRAGEYPNFMSDTIIGSQWADILINEGRIDGEIDLGGGNDDFTQRSAYQLYHLVLGDGDDVFRLETAQSLPSWVYGGDGFDRYLIAADVADVRGTGHSDFEQVEIAAGAFKNIQGFYGIESFLLGAGGSYNIFNSLNPDTDLALDRVRLILGAGARFRDIVGTGGSESVQLSGLSYGAAVVRDVRLGDGDDQFIIYSPFDSRLATIEGTVDGGAGRDDLSFVVTDGRTIDVGGYTGFESIGGSIVFSTPFDMRIVNADGYLQINSWSRLTLGDSNSPDALLRLAGGSHTTIEAGTVLRAIGGTGNENGAFLTLLDYYYPDQWTDITNAGKISLGNVILDHGDDHYDGRLGSVGGTIYGLGGDDTLLAGDGADVIDGGFGADRIQGGGGSDQLTGGGGADVFAFHLPDSASVLRADGHKSLGDMIGDFTSGVDRIDLSAIDAIAGTPGDDAFSWIGALAFSGHAGELRVAITGGIAYVAIDVDGDAIADLNFSARTLALNPLDFIL